MARCRQEECPNWSGDGRVCPCALFDLDTDAPHPLDDDDLELPESY
ncbi:hypothetical protein [Kribbella sp. NPDC051718]